MNATLLVELLTEELPPKALSKLGDAFAQGIRQVLDAHQFLEPDSVVHTYATPRRLALTITRVKAVSPDKQVREKVLPVTIALDAQGNPSAPLQKKLAALAAQAGRTEIGLHELERATDGKAESFFFQYSSPGIALHTGVQAALDDTLGKLPIPKLMSYQRPDGSTVQFVRPAHRLTALHGDQVLPVAALGLAAGRVTLGHRFLSAGEIAIDHADHYASTLEANGRVIPSFSARRDKIRAALLDKAGNDLVLMPDALLDEVTALVEWPVVYACQFEQEFLAVPQECLILTMQTNQKYFALTDHQQRLRSRFLIVSNIETTDPQHIIGGNERVVRPRLSDAKFFFEQDKKKRLEDRLPALGTVVYHNKLGSQGQRTERVMVLAGKIAERLDADRSLAIRGAQLAKTDLVTDMVGEFPELQGIMGRYYAAHDGEHPDVAAAAAEHYQPRFAGDQLPATTTGTIVALADKLETLVGIWGIGLQPTGDKDPFALRRHALGVLRMLLEKRMPLSINALLDDATTLFAGNAHFKAAPAELYAFLLDRLRGLLRERGYAQNDVEAVVAQQPDQLQDIIERLDAVVAFARLPEAEALAAANKRITNILKKNASEAQVAFDPSLLRDDAEQALHKAMAAVAGDIAQAFERRDFAATLAMLARLRADVDTYFDKVMVMAEDIALRNNRIAMLSVLHTMMNRVADISKLVA